MILKINGESKEIETHEIFLVDLLNKLEISSDTKGIAVAVNETMIRRPEWNNFILTEGDAIEIVTARQGG